MNDLKCFEADEYLGTVAGYNSVYKFETPVGEKYIVVKGHNVPDTLIVGEEAIDYENKLIGEQ